MVILQVLNGWFVKDYALTADEYAPLLEDMDTKLAKAAGYIQTIKFKGASTGDVKVFETDLLGNPLKGDK